MAHVTMGKEAIICLWVLCLPVLLAVLSWYWFSGGNATCRGARSSAARRLILGLELGSKGAGCNPPYCQRHGEPGMIPVLKTNTILFHQVIYSFHWGSAAGIRLRHLVFCFEFVLSSLRQPPDRWCLFPPRLFSFSSDVPCSHQSMFERSSLIFAQL